MTTKSTTTAIGHTIDVTAELENQPTPRYISYTILIDGFLFEQGQDDTDNGKYNEDDCTRYQLRNTAEMLEAGMLRRVGSKWELAQNAEWPIPAGYRPEWPENQ